MLIFWEKKNALVNNVYLACIMLCGVWGARVRVQVSRRGLHTHINLDYVRVKFFFVSKKNTNYKKKF